MSRNCATNQHRLCLPGEVAVPPLVTLVPAANATVYRVYEYAVPVTTVATVPSAYPTTAGIPGIAAYPAGKGFGAI